MFISRIGLNGANVSKPYVGLVFVLSGQLVSAVIAYDGFALQSQSINTM